MILRAGRDDDAADFIDLIGACWAEYPGCVMDVDGEVPELRALASYYAAQSGALWVHEAGGVVAGMVGTKPLGDGAWEICKMYVSAALRGRGVAQALIEAAEGFARGRGAVAMKLWSDTRFDRAHRFYEKLGYLRDGPIRALNDLSNTLEFAYSKPIDGVRVLDAAAAASAVPGLSRLGGDAAAWRAVAKDVALGRRLLLAGWVGGVLAGTVQVALSRPERAEIEGLIVTPGMAGQRLLAAAEAAAGRGLLVAETMEAEAVFRAADWIEAGRLPDGTVIFYRQPVQGA